MLLRTCHIFDFSSRCPTASGITPLPLSYPGYTPTFKTVSMSRFNLTPLFHSPGCLTPPVPQFSSPRSHSSKPYPIPCRPNWSPFQVPYCTADSFYYSSPPPIKT